MNTDDKGLKMQIEVLVEEFANMVGCDFTGENATECNFLRTRFLDFVKVKESQAAQRAREEVLEVAEGMRLKESDYVRNHSMRPHPSTTLTNADRRAFNRAIDDLKARFAPLQDVAGK